MNVPTPGPRSLTTLYRSGDLHVGVVRCRAGPKERPREEFSSRHDIVFVRSGQFVKQVGGRRVVGDPNHILFFNGAEPYCVTHPVAGGDDCLILSLPADDLLDVAAAHDPTVRDRPERPFRATHTLSSPDAVVLQTRLCAAATLWADARALAVEELALDLADAGLAALSRPFGPAVTTPPRRPQTARAHREVAEAAVLVLGQRYRESLSL